MISSVNTVSSARTRGPTWMLALQLGSISLCCSGNCVITIQSGNLAAGSLLEMLVLHLLCSNVNRFLPARSIRPIVFLRFSFSMTYCVVRREKGTRMILNFSRTKHFVMNMKRIELSIWKKRNFIPVLD